jgi:hypothetical protein
MLVAPAVMELRWRENLKLHQLMLAFSVCGQHVCQLRIGDQWSGWHGGWANCAKSWAKSICHVFVHFAGNNNKLRHKIFFKTDDNKLAVNTYNAWGSSFTEEVQVVMVTCLTTLLSIEDDMRDWEIVDDEM